MQTFHRPLIVYHADLLLRERLRATLRWGFEYAAVGSWAELEAAVQGAAPSAVVVVDPYAEVPGRRELAPELRALLERHPSLTVLAALEVRPGDGEHLLRLGEWGVVQVIALDEPEGAARLARRLREARGRPLRGLVERALEVAPSGPARAILVTASAVVMERGRGTELAAALHVAPRTLLRWCRRAGLPPPKQLLAWMRLLLAAELLDDPGRTVLDVALDCGYSSDGGLRHAMQSLMGVSPRALRQQGAFASASAAFLAALKQTRQESLRSRRSRAMVGEAGSG